MQQPRRGLGAATGWILGLLFAGLLVPPTAARAIDRTDVHLGPHRFGRLSKPDAIVARVAAKDVGFDTPEEGPFNGPWSFDVAADGTIWLLDQFNYRLLVWEPGRPDRPARSVPIPQDEVRVAADLALGPDSTIYLSYIPATPPDQRKTLRVLALDPDGDLLWTEPSDIRIFNDRLRTGPDGTLYTEGGMRGAWTPLTSPDGDPLPLADQRAGRSPFQPMPGGLRFEADEVSEGDQQEWRFTLLGENDHVVGAWRVTSEDELGGTIDEPGMVDGDPIVTIGIARETPQEYLYEYVTLRLPVAGGMPKELVSLDPDAVFGGAPITGLRVGPDGRLYQLRTDIDAGVSIAAYSLGAVQTSPSPSAEPSTPTPPATATSGITPRAATPTASGTSDSGVPPILWMLIGLALVGLVALLRYRRRGRGAGS